MPAFLSSALLDTNDPSTLNHWTGEVGSLAVSGGAGFAEVGVLILAAHPVIPVLGPCLLPSLELPTVSANSTSACCGNSVLFH